MQFQKNTLTEEAKNELNTINEIQMINGKLVDR